MFGQKGFRPYLIAIRGLGMPRMADEHQPLVPERVNIQPVQPPGITGQPEVHGVVHHRAMHPVNQAIANPDFDLGEIPPELPEDGRQLMQADTVTGGQFNDAGGGVPGLLHPLGQLPGEPDNFPAMLVANLACRCQLEYMPTPVHQPRTEFLLQGLQHLADGGLRDAIPFRRPGEVLGFNHIAEQPQRV